MTPPILKTWLAEPGHPELLTAEPINEKPKHSSPDTSQQVSDWKHDGCIYSVKINNHEYFPAYQLDLCCEPLLVVREILAELAPLADSGKIAAWFHFLNGWISDDEGLPVAPKDALNRPGDVTTAAGRNRTTYIA
jgi:hypothetical protein